MSFCVRLGILSPLILIGLVFIILRVNENITWSWGIILIPEWLLALIILYIVINDLTISNSRDGGRAKFWHVWRLICYFILLAFTVLLTVKLDVSHVYPWAIPFIPIWTILFMALMIILSKFVSSQEGRYTYYLLLWIFTLISSITFPIQFHLDDDHRMHWMLCFLGIWLTIFFVFITLFLYLLDKMDVIHVSNGSKVSSYFMIQSWIAWVGITLFMGILTFKLQTRTAAGT